MQKYLNIGARIKEERLRLGIKQLELAEFVDISRHSQANYEKGERVPDALYLEKILELGFDSYYIISGQRSKDFSSRLDEDSQNTKNHENTTNTETYLKQDTDLKVRHSSPALNQQVGLNQVMENASEYLASIDSAELSAYGKKWWKAVSELSQEEKDAVLTLVFSHTVSKLLKLDSDDAKAFALKDALKNMEGDHN
jgi:transcriptional regulator with XRE-family HTH domain